METLASAATFVIELFAEVAEAEALSVVRAMLSSPQIFEMLEKLDYSNYCRISIAYSRIKRPPVESGRWLEASISIMHVALRFHNCDAITEDC